MIADHHSTQDRQSLLLHQEAVRMLRCDPSLESKALGILTRWEAQVCASSKPLRDKWVEIISTRNWSMALEESERGNQLRQASPLAILLPNAVRLRIMRAAKNESVQMLKAMHRKDAEDVAAGRRSARSLLMFQKSDLKGFRSTPNPASEFERNGDGW